MRQLSFDRLLGWMFLPALGALIYAVVDMWLNGQVDLALILVGIILAVAVLVMSRQRAKSPRRRAQVAFALCALAYVAMICTNELAMPLMIIAVTAVIVDCSFAAGVVAWLFTGVLTLVLIGTFGVEQGHLWGNVVAPLLMTSFGLALGAVFRELEAQRRHALQLISNLDSTNAELDAALAELRSAAAIEKELVLAEERHRAAQDLHDGLGHRLTLVGMSLDFAGRMQQRDPQRALEEVRVARKITVEALNEMRLWVRALSPVRADSARGIDGFDAIAESFRGTGVDVQVDVQPELPELSHEADLLACRFVQEGLTNALRHSRARQINVSAQAVGADRSHVRVMVRNPVTPGSLGEGSLDEGFGLRSLRERAEKLGGTAVARVADGQVCAVLELPVAVVTA